MESSHSSHFASKNNIYRMKSLFFLSLLCLAMADHKGYEEPPFKVIKHAETLEVRFKLFLLKRFFITVMCVV